MSSYGNHRAVPVGEVSLSCRMKESLVKKIGSLNTNLSPREVILCDYKDIFEGVGCMPQEYHIDRTRCYSSCTPKVPFILHLCLDPRDLNKVIKRENYKIPTADEIASKLTTKKVFLIILDEKDGFWQIPLDQESSFPCTFHSSFERYHFSRCPFGISSAPAVFQKRNDQLFSTLRVYM